MAAAACIVADVAVSAPRDAAGSAGRQQGLAKLASSTAAGPEDDSCLAPCQRQYLKEVEAADAQHAASDFGCRRKVGMGMLKSAGQLAFLAAMVWVGRETFCRMFAGRERTAARIAACVLIAMWLLHMKIATASHERCVDGAFHGKLAALHGGLADFVECCAPCDDGECWSLYQRYAAEVDAMEENP